MQTESIMLCRLQPAQMSVNFRIVVRKRMNTSASCALTIIASSCSLTVATWYAHEASYAMLSDGADDACCCCP